MVRNRRSLVKCSGSFIKKSSFIAGMRFSTRCGEIWTHLDHVLGEEIHGHTAHSRGDSGHQNHRSHTSRENK